MSVRKISAEKLLEEETTPQLLCVCVRKVPAEKVLEEATTPQLFAATVV